VDLILFLRDANDENWREVLKADTDCCSSHFQHLAVFGVCGRNVECWICADADWIAKKTGTPAAEFRVADPKPAFESSMGVTSRNRREKEIADLVRESPLRNWLANQSFESFYLCLWQKSKQHNCAIENLRERPGESDLG
jgi:hypothetical protein